MNLHLDMSMRLQQKLSFQMIQSLKLLQVNTLQLEQMLKTELEMNPLLVASEEDIVETPEQEATKEEEPSEPDEAGEDADLKVDEESIDWENYLEEGFDLGYSAKEEIDHNEEHYEPIQVYQNTLEEHLTGQIAEKKLPEKKQLLVQFLIGSLDMDGYLRMPLDDISHFTKTSIIEVEEALQILKSFDPPGVGARNLRECLVLCCFSSPCQCDVTCDSLGRRVRNQRSQRIRLRLKHEQRRQQKQSYDDGSVQALPT